MGQSLVKKGEDLELKYSTMVHTEGVPLLLSPLVLRSYNLGQVDLAVIKDVCGEKLIVCYEIKKYMGITKRQIRRVKRSATFLSHLINLPAVTRLIVESKNFAK